MRKICSDFFFLLAVVLLFSSYSVLSEQNEDGSEQWGYVEVRPKAHMFWWLYRSPQRQNSKSTPWPLILWLQGGPGASGVGIGNFEEIGPLDTNLKPRNSTWLQIADLLFVDNPVGTGFSFVEDKNLLVKSEREATSDLIVLLKMLFNKSQILQRSPLFIVAQSYGGKFAVSLTLSILESIETNELKLTFGGVCLGDSWISPEDFVLSWGPLLKDMSRLDDKDADKANRAAHEIERQIANGQYEEATDSWSALESFIVMQSNGVDMYNFLLEEQSSSSLASELLYDTSTGYSKYFSSKASSPSTPNLRTFMDTVVRQKLKIIPQVVRFGEQAEDVFVSLSKDFMKPRIQEVDELLAKGVNVTIYNGQLDVICSAKGVQAWMQKLKWGGMEILHNMSLTPLYCDGLQSTKGFMKSYKNLHLYWILGAGHFVPVDQPCVTLKMMSMITQSPTSILS